MFKNKTSLTLQIPRRASALFTSSLILFFFLGFVEAAVEKGFALTIVNYVLFS